MTEELITRVNKANLPKKSAQIRTGDYFQIRNVVFSDVDKTRLSSFIKQELTLYNSLVNSLHPILKRSPNDFLELTDDDIELLSWIAHVGHNLDINSIVNGNIETPIPELLEKWREKLLGKDSTGKRKLSDKFITFAKIVCTNTSISMNMRRNMVSEILNFYKNQSKLAVRKMKDKGGDDSYENMRSYQSNFQFLETLDLPRKRHVQLLNPKVDPYSSVKLETNQVKDEEGNVIRVDSYIKTPYNINKIKIENFDIYNDFRWKIMIIHQRKGQYPTSDTPWNIELHNTKANYLLEYRESNNPSVSTLSANKPIRDTKFSKGSYKKVEQKSQRGLTTKSAMTFA